MFSFNKQTNQRQLSVRLHQARLFVGSISRFSVIHTFFLLFTRQGIGILSYFPLDRLLLHHLLLELLLNPRSQTLLVEPVFHAVLGLFIDYGLAPLRWPFQHGRLAMKIDYRIARSPPHPLLQLSVLRTDYVVVALQHRLETVGRRDRVRLVATLVDRELLGHVRHGIQLLAQLLALHYHAWCGQ